MPQHVLAILLVVLHAMPMWSAAQPTPSDGCEGACCPLCADACPCEVDRAPVLPEAPEPMAPGLESAIPVLLRSEAVFVSLAGPDRGLEAWRVGLRRPTASAGRAQARTCRWLM